MPRYIFSLLLIGLSLIPTNSQAQDAPARPNIIFIITDDQGYGDIAAHGNELIRTPHLDAMHGESVRLTDYHVDPTCSPTRSALMTGRYSTRTGVWHTINGRSLLAGDEYTLAEYLRDNGYQTAMFGKWHLGDNAPLRPVDQGFDYSVWHNGGGVTQGPDYFGNDYFDDTYVDNGEHKKFEGYCTDVWFSEAVKFIEQADEDEPFFVYLSTNAPHGPFFVDDKYSQPYKDMGVPEQSANFYGMIENIDDNLGMLRAWLKEQGLAENTLLIFTTDNGTARGNFREVDGVKGFNAGMRGNKGSNFDGGHRVPFFLHWPAGGLDEGREIDLLCSHLDVMPTLGALAGAEPLAQDKLVRGPIDGRSIAPLLDGSGDVEPTGVRIVHSQRIHDPEKWRNCAVMTEQWRLINGKELYDIIADPGQENDIAADHPEVVAELTAAYDHWWESLSPVFDEVVRIDLGGDENPVMLMSHDWLVDEGHAPWHQNDVINNKLMNGPFMVNIVQPGKYRITPMRWAEHVDKPSGCVRVSIDFTFQNADPSVPAAMGHMAECEPGGAIPSFEVTLPAGPASLTTTLTREDGETFGAYYVKVELVNE